MLGIVTTTCTGWWKTLAILMSVKPEDLLGNIKIANVFHYPVQAQNMNFNPYIYILYYQSNKLNYLPPNPASYPCKMDYYIPAMKYTGGLWKRITISLHFSWKPYMRLKSYSQVLICNPELVWISRYLTALSRDAADDVTLVYTASSTFLHS